MTDGINAEEWRMVPIIEGGIGRAELENTVQTMLDNDEVLLSVNAVEMLSSILYREGEVVYCYECCEHMSPEEAEAEHDEKHTATVHRLENREQFVEALENREPDDDWCSV